MFALRNEHTYTTLNECVGTYTGSPGATTLDLGHNKLKLVWVEVDNNEDKIGVMSNGTNVTNMTNPEEYTKEALFEILHEMRMLQRSSRRGSAPKKK